MAGLQLVPAFPVAFFFSFGLGSHLNPLFWHREIPTTVTQLLTRHFITQSLLLFKLIIISLLIIKIITLMYGTLVCYLLIEFDCSFESRAYFLWKFPRILMKVTPKMLSFGMIYISQIIQSSSLTNLEESDIFTSVKEHK